MFSIFWVFFSEAPFLSCTLSFVPSFLIASPVLPGEHSFTLYFSPLVSDSCLLLTGQGAATLRMTDQTPLRLPQRKSESPMLAQPGWHSAGGGWRWGAEEELASLLYNNIRAHRKEETGRLAATVTPVSPGCLR